MSSTIATLNNWIPQPVQSHQEQCFGCNTVMDTHACWIVQAGPMRFYACCKKHAQVARAEARIYGRVRTMPPPEPYPALFTGATA